MDVLQVAVTVIAAEEKSCKLQSPFINELFNNIFVFPGDIAAVGASTHLTKLSSSPQIHFSLRFFIRKDYFGQHSTSGEFLPNLLMTVR